MKKAFFLSSLLFCCCHPNLEKSWKKDALLLIEADKLIIACERHKNINGEYPKNLDELDPGVWKSMKLNLRDNKNVKIIYYGGNDGRKGLTIDIPPIQYDFDFDKWQSGWQQSDQSF